MDHSAVTQSQPQHPNLNFNPADYFKEKPSKKIKIAIAFLALMVVATGILTAYLIFARFTGDPSKHVTFDIPNNILNQQGVENNKIENRLIDDKLVTSYSVDQIDRLSASLYPSYSKLAAKYGEDEYLIHFYSTDENGQPLTIRAQVFVPKGAPGDKFPLFVFGQGTTGLGDKCAPSLEKPSVDNWGNYYNHLRTYAGQGFITVFPDYEGFNDDKRIHHYFNSQLESNVLLDATRATFEFIAKNKKVQAEQAAFYGGYSQGGNSIFAVKDNQATYAPDVPVKGIVGFGATTNIGNLLRENPPLAPYLFYAYADFYGKDKVNASQLLQPKWLPTFEKDVLGKCISEASRYYGSNAANIYSTKFYDALFSRKLEQEFPELNKLFEANSPGLKSNSIPALIIQGNPDPIVTIQSQEEFIEQACKAGSIITYKIYQGVHHYQTRHVSFKDAVDWMKSVLAGTKPQSVCGNLDNLGPTNTQQVPEYENDDVPNFAPPGGSGGG